MDWEVISIGGSRSKDTHQGASNNESSSTKRVRASRQTGGGASRPRGGSWLSATAGEPVPVTVNLPPSASGGVRKGRGGGHVRASPCMRRSLCVRLPLSIPTIAGYEWVRGDVLKYKSSLTLATSVIAL